jgi:hypothetical protein
MEEVSPEPESRAGGVMLPNVLPVSVIGRRHKPGFFVEYLLDFPSKGRRKAMKVWVDVALLVDHFQQWSESTPGKLAIVEKVLTLVVSVCSHPCLLKRLKCSTLLTTLSSLFSM